MLLLLDDAQRVRGEASKELPPALAYAAGFKADLVVFDPETVHSPAALKEPKQFAIGIDYVIVNGTLVADQDHHTDALPGRALRR